MTLFCTTRLKALALFGTILAAAACTDLTEQPYTEITESNFKPTARDLAALMAPVYTPLRCVWMDWQAMLDWQEETADVLLTPVRPNGWDDGGIYYQNHQHRWNAASPGMPNALWGRAFNGINAANRVIYQLESGLLPVTEETRAPVIAELRAVRAYYYYLLLDNFGNIPIVTDWTVTDPPQQTPRAEAYAFVVRELRDVLPQLSDVSGLAMYGRMTQWAAKGILARIYLNAEVYTGTARWDSVLVMTQDIISSGKFQLDVTYRGPFSRNNSTSPEIIFAVPYDAIYSGQSNGCISSFHMKTLKPDLRYVFNMTVGPWGGSAANPQWIDTYDPDDGRLNDTWLRGPHFIKGPQFGDDSAGYNFVQYVPNMRDTPQGGRVEYYHGYPVWKYEIYPGMSGSSDVDYPVVRYADVLLMKAEALLRTGDAAGAAALVTQVRQRNFKGTAAGKATVTGAELLQGSRYNYGWYDFDGVVKTGPGGARVENGGADIRYGRFLDELGWELAVEGQRRQQLIRFGVFTTKTWFNHTPNGDYRVLFAIPQSRLDTNGNLQQNPGY